MRSGPRFVTNFCCRARQPMAEPRLMHGCTVFKPRTIMTCVAESTPTRPTRAGTAERRLRANQEKAWHRPPTTAMPVLSPQIAALFLVIGALLRAESCQRTRRPRIMTKQSRTRCRVQQQEDGENHLLSWRFLLSPGRGKLLIDSGGMMI